MLTDPTTPASCSGPSPDLQVASASRTGSAGPAALSLACFPCFPCLVDACPSWVSTLPLAGRGHICCWSFVSVERCLGRAPDTGQGLAVMASALGPRLSPQEELTLCS